MSTDIVYHQTIVRLPRTVSGLDADLYYWIHQVGSSNCYEFDTFDSLGRRRPGRRSRNWGVFALGTREQMIRLAITAGGDCEGGMVHLGYKGGHVTPESYIRRVRRMLDKADKAGPEFAYREYPVSFELKAVTGDVRYDPVSEIQNFVSDHPYLLTSRFPMTHIGRNFSGPRL